MKKKEEIEEKIEELEIKQSKIQTSGMAMNSNQQEDYDYLQAGIILLEWVLNK
tara:strand:+ start:189 stop:347 length:159 start_codon:yes stop_codon:yes gene_type:complete